MSYFERARRIPRTVKIMFWTSFFSLWLAGCTTDQYGNVQLAPGVTATLADPTLEPTKTPFPPTYTPEEGLAAQDFISTATVAQASSEQQIESAGGRNREEIEFNGDLLDTHGQELITGETATPTPDGYNPATRVAAQATAAERMMNDFEQQLETASTATAEAANSTNDAPPEIPETPTPEGEENESTVNQTEQASMTNIEIGQKFIDEIIPVMAEEAGYSIDQVINAYQQNGIIQLNSQGEVTYFNTLNLANLLNLIVPKFIDGQYPEIDMFESPYGQNLNQIQFNMSREAFAFGGFFIETTSSPTSITIMEPDDSSELLRLYSDDGDFIVNPDGTIQFENPDFVYETTESSGRVFLTDESGSKPYTLNIRLN